MMSEDYPWHTPHERCRGWAHPRIATSTPCGRRSWQDGKGTLVEQSFTPQPTRVDDAHTTCVK